MVMVISKFHRLIQSRSRLLWGAILIVIVFSFVIWGIQAPGRSRNRRETLAVGTLYGKPVSAEEYQETYRHLRLGLLLSFGDRMSVNDEIDKRLRAAAWRRLATLREAQNAGVVASDAEVVEAVRTHPAFAANGQFSVQRYRAFFAEMLGPQGFTERFFEEHIREELSLDKLRRMIDQAVLIPAADLQRTFSTLSDSFKAEYAELKPALATNGLQVTEEAARAFFDKDPARYTLPVQVQVKCIVLDPKKYFVEVGDVSEDDARDYFDEHSNEYTKEVPDTNAAPGAASSATGAVQVAGATNGPAGTGAVASAAGAATNAPAMRTVRRTFEEARGEIVAAMKKDRARGRARTVADEFIKLIAPYFSDHPATFEEAAAKLGLPVRRPPPFGKDETVSGVPADKSFREAAFDLRNNPDEYFSNPITTDEGVYVLALDRRLPKRVPEFAEVQSRVLEDVREKAIADRLGEKAAQVRKAVTEEKKSFKDAARSLGLEARETPEFTATAGLDDAGTPYAHRILRTVLSHNAGEFADPISTEEGGLLVVYVAGRKPGDPTTLASMRPELVSMLRRERGQQVFGDWQEWLLREAKFSEPHPSGESEEERPPDQEPTPRKDQGGPKGDPSDAM